MTNKENAFDQAALQWDSNPDRLKLHQQTAEKIISRIPEKNNWRALDFGCGTGIMSFLLSPHLDSIDCIDSSAGMIEELHKKLNQQGAPENITPHCVLLESGTFPPESFDMLFSVLTLHHVREVEKLIKIFAEIIRPGGRIILIDLDKEDGCFHKKTETSVYHHGFEREYIGDLLRGNGFTAIYAETAACRKREMDDGSTRAYPLFMISATKP
jgi:ubiquinone/menaquinone biosynthesis C-methylase UbiE